MMLWRPHALPFILFSPWWILSLPRLLLDRSPTTTRTARPCLSALYFLFGSMLLLGSLFVRDPFACRATATQTAAESVAVRHSALARRSRSDQLRSVPPVAFSPQWRWWGKLRVDGMHQTENAQTTAHVRLGQQHPWLSISENF